MTDPESLLTPLRQFIDSNAFDDAEKYMETLISLKSTPAEFWLLAGQIFKNASRSDLALKTLNQGLKLHPYFVPTYLDMADILIEKKEYEKAEKSLVIANKLIPNQGLIEGKLGQTYLKIGNYKASITWTTLAIQHEPQVPDLYNILGDAHLRLGQLDEAGLVLEKGLAIEPDFPRLLNTYASIFALREEYQRSNAILDRALEIEPDFAQAHLKRGVNLLTLGDLSSGWAEYEYRRQLPSIRNPRQNCPEWKGESLEGKAILIWTEQGLGDTIQYFRYLYRVKALGAKIIFECRPVLFPLFENHPVLEGILLRGADRPHIDLHCSIMSLPKYFERSLEDRHCVSPYIFPAVKLNDDLMDFIQKLDSIKTYKVGLTWAGNPDNKNDRNRSIPDEKLIDLLALDSVQFINLQFGNIVMNDELRQLPDPTGYISNFAETAHVLEKIDLVISVDTSMCHLAGALGRPVWTLLPFNPDFRWGLNTGKTDYYPSMRLFRQSTLNDWESVIRRVISELTALAGKGT
ncbi:MAG: hypothetical protein GXO90_01450 [FCB group bacterium]|nr:hypothetical protein [FCB group bacterium]